MQVNHKWVDRVYAEQGCKFAGTSARRCRVAARHPLARPLAANQVWSMDFVFDRTAEGRVIRGGSRDRAGARDEWHASDACPRPVGDNTRLAQSDQDR